MLLRNCRAKASEDSKMWIYGFYCQIRGEHRLIDHNGNILEFAPRTLSMSIGKQDKLKIFIFGSVIIDEEMSSGGDIVQYNDRIHYVKESGDIFTASPCCGDWSGVWAGVNIIGNGIEDPELLEEILEK